MGGNWVKLTRVNHWRALRKRHLTFRLSQMREDRGDGGGGDFLISFSKRALLCVRVVNVEDYLMKLGTKV